MVSTKKSKTKNQDIIQDTTINVFTNRMRRRNTPTILDKIPPQYKTHNMRPDPDTNLALLHSRIDSLATNQISLFQKAHQEAINLIRSIKVNPKAIEASVDPQHRFAQPAPGQAPITGENPAIDLNTPQATPSGPINGNTGNEVTPIQLHFESPNLEDVAGPSSRQPQNKGLDSSPDMEDRFLTRKQLGGYKAQETVKSKGVREYKDNIRQRLRPSGVSYVNATGTLESQSLPTSTGSLNTPPSVASSSRPFS
jgi:hypothetical protein